MENSIVYLNKGCRFVPAIKLKKTNTMTTKKITSELNKVNICFTIENRYNEVNQEIFFKVNGIEIEADITTGKALGFINEKGRVFTSLKQIFS